MRTLIVYTDDLDGMAFALTRAGIRAEIHEAPEPMPLPMRVRMKQERKP